jgi:hypothetical protein
MLMTWPLRMWDERRAAPDRWYSFQWSFLMTTASAWLSPGEPITSGVGGGVDAYDLTAADEKGAAALLVVMAGVALGWAVFLRSGGRGRRAGRRRLSWETAGEGCLGAGRDAKR